MSEEIESGDRPSAGEGRVGELYAAIVEWARGEGADNLKDHPGLWHRKTNKCGILGPFDVRINGHSEAVEGVPPFHAKIGMDGCFPGIIGVLGPFGGVLMGSTVPGEDEEGLIEHFKAQTSPIPASLRAGLPLKHPPEQAGEGRR